MGRSFYYIQDTFDNYFNLLHLFITSIIGVVLWKEQIWSCTPCQIKGTGIIFPIYTFYHIQRLKKSLFQFVCLLQELSSLVLLLLSSNLKTRCFLIGFMLSVLQKNPFAVHESLSRIWHCMQKQLPLLANSFENIQEFQLRSVAL